MKDFILRNKVFISVIAITSVLLFGGVALMSRNDDNPTAVKKFSNEVLSPSDSQKTSGIVNGNYQPATPSATVILVEFGDYQCPACGAYHPFVKQLLTELAGKITFVFRNFPLSQHSNANIASYAAEAAGLQGKFWQMHDKLYETQNEWSTSSDAKNIFVSYAQSLGLNIDQFKKDIDSDTVKKIIVKGTNDGNLVGLDATPTFYVNGAKIALPNNYEEFKSLVTSSK